MSGTMQIRDHLLQELQLGVKTSCSLIKLIREEEWDFRPQDNMRTLLQLVHHLTAIPASDLAILQEKPQPEVDKVEHSASDIRDTEELVRRFQANYDTFRDYIVALSEDELLKVAESLAPIDPQALRDMIGMQ